MTTDPSTDDDDLEIDLIVHEQARAVHRQRRAENPAVDEVIQSGEIAEPRSRIVRATTPAAGVPTQGYADAGDLPGEMTVAPARARAIGRVIWLAAAALLALAAIALWLAVATPTAKPTAKPVASDGADRIALQGAADLVGMTLDAETRALEVRANAMASSSMLRAAIDTDATTLADMVRDKDVQFPLRTGEALEIFQVRDGKRTLLLRLPGGAHALQAPAPGTSQLVRGTRGLTVIADAAIPGESPGSGGELVLSGPADLGPIEGRLTEHAITASLVGLGPAIPLVTARTPGATKVSIPVRTGEHVELHLEATIGASSR